MKFYKGKCKIPCIDHKKDMSLNAFGEDRLKEANRERLRELDR